MTRRPISSIKHDQIDEAKPAAAIILGIDDPEPALLGELTPECVGHRLRGGHTLAHKAAVAFALEEFARGLPQQFLLLAKPDIHRAPPLADFEWKVVRLQERKAIPIPSLKGDLVLFDPKEAASAQPERVSPFEDRPLSILENVLDDTDHFRFGKLTREHLADRRPARDRLPDDLMIDRIPGVKGRYFIRIAPVKCLDEG